MSRPIFADFDFSLLDDPQFKEDSVREELITPLLKQLGYSSASQFRIVRSKSLTHPFVYIGTKKHEVKIIPDYVLEVGNDHRWILDAKNPTEHILSGKNVEQAFSYAIHPDIRAFKYALCNGAQIAVFDIRKIEPVLVMNMCEVSDRFNELYEQLSPIAFTNPALLKYRPDFGLYLLKLGLTDKTIQHFVPIGLPFIAKIEDDLYSAVVDTRMGDDWYCLSFDFDERRYQQLLRAVSSDMSTRIRDALRKQPFKITLDCDAPELNVRARLGDTIHSNDNEDYCPLVVENFS